MGKGRKTEGIENILVFSNGVLVRVVEKQMDKKKISLVEKIERVNYINLLL